MSKINFTLLILKPTHLNSPFYLYKLENTKAFLDFCSLSCMLNDLSSFIFINDPHKIQRRAQKDL